MSEKENVPQEGEFKMKKKRGRPKKLVDNTKATARIDLTEKQTNTSENAVQESKTEEPVLQSEETKEEQDMGLQEVGQTHEEKATEEVKPVIEEIKEEEQEVVSKTETPQQPELPEGIQNLVDFMKETGGNMQDYLRLNADYTNVDDDVLLKEYYKNTKPHLESDEIDFIMEEQFKVDEDYDEEREIRRKKLAKKEEVAKAKGFLEELKQKYYEEIKLRPTENNELTKAKEFFNKFSKEKEIAQKQHEMFKSNTKEYFSDIKGL